VPALTALSLDDAVAQIAAQTSLSPADVRDFLSCSDEERVALVQVYRDSNAMPAASDWDKVLAVLKVCGQVAGLVAPIAGAVAAVYGLGKALAD
jgi:hypothetical protein